MIRDRQRAARKVAEGVPDAARPRDHCQDSQLAPRIARQSPRGDGEFPKRSDARSRQRHRLCGGCAVATAAALRSRHHQQLVAVRDRDRSARALRGGGEDARIERANGDERGLDRAADKRDGRRGDQQDLPVDHRQSGAGAARLARLANHGARVEAHREMRGDDRLRLTAVESEPVDRAPESLPPGLGQQEVTQRRGVDLGVERGGQSGIGGAVLNLGLQRAEQRLESVSRAEPGGARIVRPPLAAAPPRGPPEDDHRGARQRQE